MPRKSSDDPVASPVIASKAKPSSRVDISPSPSVEVSPSSKRQRSVSPEQLEYKDIAAETSTDLEARIKNYKQIRKEMLEAEAEEIGYRIEQEAKKVKSVVEDNMPFWEPKSAIPVKRELSEEVKAEFPALPNMKQIITHYTDARKYGYCIWASPLL